MLADQLRLESFLIGDVWNLLQTCDQEILLGQQSCRLENAKRQLGVNKNEINLHNLIIS